MCKKFFLSVNPYKLKHSKTFLYNKSTKKRSKDTAIIYTKQTIQGIIVDLWITSMIDKTPKSSTNTLNNSKFSFLHIYCKRISPVNKYSENKRTKHLSSFKEKKKLFTQNLWNKQQQASVFIHFNKSMWSSRASNL